MTKRNSPLMSTKSENYLDDKIKGINEEAPNDVEPDVVVFQKHLQEIMKNRNLSKTSPANPPKGNECQGAIKTTVTPRR